VRDSLESSLDRLADYSDAALLAELRRLATFLGTSRITIRDIDDHARCSYALLKQRFGGLTNALNAAGLGAPTFHRDIPEDELLDELERVWEETLSKDGRRPYSDDLARYESKFSRGPYYRRWASWIRACEAVLARSARGARSKSDERRLTTSMAEQPVRRSSVKRGIPLGLRYGVMRRDRFLCQVCGCSPATHPGTVLHVDHVHSESKGGETVEGNLRTLCENCNLGKGAS
jgi:5-methylcytosine-specific restriction endonuclease McrA